MQHSFIALFEIMVRFLLTIVSSHKKIRDFSKFVFLRTLRKISNVCGEMDSRTSRNQDQKFTNNYCYPSNLIFFPTCRLSSMSRMSTRLTSILHKAFLYNGFLKDIVCHPGLAVQSLVFLPDLIHSCIWNVKKKHKFFIFFEAIFMRSPDLQLFDNIRKRVLYS